MGHIRREELLRAGERVGVAVSGGIDSVALLRVLLELRGEFGIVLSVVHFNHGLRGAESDADQEFVGGLAREYELEFYSDSGDVARLAAQEGSGVEAAARELRYGFFRWLLGADEDDERASRSNLEVPQGLKPDRLPRSAERCTTARLKPCPSRISYCPVAIPPDCACQRAPDRPSQQDRYRAYAG